MKTVTKIYGEGRLDSRLSSPMSQLNPLFINSRWQAAVWSEPKALWHALVSCLVCEAMMVVGVSVAHRESREGGPPGEGLPPRVRQGSPNLQARPSRGGSPPCWWTLRTFQMTSPSVILWANPNFPTYHPVFYTSVHKRDTFSCIPIFFSPTRGVDFLVFCFRGRGYNSGIKIGHKFQDVLTWQLRRAKLWPAERGNVFACHRLSSSDVWNFHTPKRVFSYF